MEILLGSLKFLSENIKEKRDKMLNPCNGGKY